MADQTTLSDCLQGKRLSLACTWRGTLTITVGATFFPDNLFGNFFPPGTVEEAGQLIDAFALFKDTDCDLPNVSATGSGGQGFRLVIL